MRKDWDKVVIEMKDERGGVIEGVWRMRMDGLVFKVNLMLL